MNETFHSWEKMTRQQPVEQIHAKLKNSTSYIVENEQRIIHRAKYITSNN